MHHQQNSINTFLENNVEIQAILINIIKMKSKTIAFSRLTHQKQRSNLSFQESLEAKRIKTITSEAQTDIVLSPFDMISWKQKMNYIPSEKIKKLKIQNDAAFYLLSREKVRIMPKVPARKVKSQLSHASLQQNYRKERHQTLGLSSKFLTDSQQSLLAQHNTPSIRAVFKQKHRVLYDQLINNHSKSKQKKKESFVSRTSGLKQQIKRQSKQKQDEKKYFKSKYEEVNRRMEGIIKNWQKEKKSVNQQYYELWVKPKVEKIKLKKISTSEKKNLNSY